MFLMLCINLSIMSIFSTECFSVLLHVKITWGTFANYPHAWTQPWKREMRLGMCISSAGVVKCSLGTLGMVAKKGSLRLPRKGRERLFTGM